MGHKCYQDMSHDAFPIGKTRMYNRYVTPQQAAMRHLKDLHPCKPEIWMTIALVKASWRSSNSKKCIPPMSLTVEDSTTTCNHRERPQNLEHMSFLQWLCAVTHQTSCFKLYKYQDTIVGIKYLSVFKEEYFFQYVLINYHHINELEPLLKVFCLVHLLNFKAATETFPDIWSTAVGVKEMLEGEDHQGDHTS